MIRAPRCRARVAGPLVVLAVLVAGGGCAAPDTAADPGPVPGSPSAPAPGGPASRVEPAAAASRVGSVVPEAPTGLTLPAGTSVPVRAVSTTDNGLLDVPDDIRAAGWWRGGSQIGDPFGSTLIAAHVDSATQGLGPFAALLDVEPGARLEVTTDTLSQVFRVRSLRLRPTGTIGPASPLHSPAGERRLTLVTCAGPFVPEQGGYQNLAVVVATPVGDPVARDVEPAGGRP